MRVGIGWNPFDRDGVGAQRFFASAEHIEALGYYSLWLTDTMARPGSAPLPALAAAAMRTTTLKLGTSVLALPPRNPVLLAKELATVDVISHGRLIAAFGIGVDVPAEIAASGIARAERVARTEEGLAVIRGLLSGEAVIFDGRFTKLDKVTLSPPPVRTDMALWLSGSSPPALRRAGTIADGWLGSFVSASAFPEQKQAIMSAAREAGRHLDDGNFGVVLWAVASHDDRDRLLRFLPPIHVQDLLKPEDIIAVGAAETRNMLDRFGAAGVGQVVLMVGHDDLDPFLQELYGEAVKPAEQRWKKGTE